MKHLANLVSLSRVFLSISLVPLRNHTGLFVVVYLVCGLSDVFDGFIARKTKTESLAGARLDSLADVFMFTAIVLILYLRTGKELAEYAPMLLAVVLVRLVSVTIAGYRFRVLVLGLHTWGNKLTGLLVYLAPLLVMTSPPEKVFMFVCLVAILSAVEEGFIQLTSRKLDLNRKSIFLKE
jgi:CDP-diacylglycerol--glycerol-3-phosphate 3-phosphatidyltransferase